MPEPQCVDPAVSRAKFDREVEDFRRSEDAYRRRGVLLQRASFPEAVVLFCARPLKPAPVLAAVRLEFTNYDIWPPSARFVDPFTHEPLTVQELRLQMLRRPQGLPVGFPGQWLGPGVMQPQCLLPEDRPDAQPFICLPGIREYHDNPAHTGDPWLLHRRSGAGSLAFIVDKIWTYGVNPVFAYHVQMASPDGVQMTLQSPALGTAVKLDALPA